MSLTPVPARRVTACGQCVPAGEFPGLPNHFVVSETIH